MSSERRLPFADAATIGMLRLMGSVPSPSPSFSISYHTFNQISFYVILCHFILLLSQHFHFIRSST